MPAEEMGKVTKRLRLIFAVSSVVFLIVLAISPVRDYLSDWRRYERDYVRFAESRPDTKRLLADFRPEIDQIWIPQMQVVDRCTTCHQGITRPSLRTLPCRNPSARTRPFPTACGIGDAWFAIVARASPRKFATRMRPHSPGNSRSCPSATSKPPAESAIAPNCRRHRASTGAASFLSRSIASAAIVCRGSSGRRCWVPNLTNIGTKVSRAWIYKWLKDPRTITASDGSVLVNGYENEDEPRMPKFRLNEKELRALSGYLSTLASEPIPTLQV